LFRAEAPRPVYLFKQAVVDIDGHSVQPSCELPGERASTLTACKHFVTLLKREEKQTNGNRSI
jgi:hypothetical protein